MCKKPLGIYTDGEYDWGNILWRYISVDKTPVLGQICIKWICMQSVQKIICQSEDFNYQFCCLDVTWQPFRGDLTMHAWTGTLLWSTQTAVRCHWVSHFLYNCHECAPVHSSYSALFYGGGAKCCIIQIWQILFHWSLGLAPSNLWVFFPKSLNCHWNGKKFWLWMRLFWNRTSQSVFG